MSGYQCTECSHDYADVEKGDRQLCPLPRSHVESEPYGTGQSSLSPFSTTDCAEAGRSEALETRSEMLCWPFRVPTLRSSSPLLESRVAAARILHRSFYARPTVEVARALLGKILMHGEAAARIVETEAYLGTADPAAHAFRGVTPRTRVLFGPSGHAYVYLIYGMYYCLNVVAEAEGTAGCVLIRAVEPVANLSGSGSGPGRLTRALGITLAHNGRDLTGGPLTIRKPTRPERFEIGISPRIGIRQAADWPLRFFVRGNPHVSRTSGIIE
jgi:DNA-3-methyladenine glycosylase